MMRVRITQGIPGSIDGIHLRQLANGSTYDVSQSVGMYLLSRGAAVLVDPTLPAVVQPIDGAFELQLSHTRSRDQAADYTRH